MRPEEARREHYRRLAKREGYRSRSAYKLIQIDERFGIFEEGQIVIDLGAAPGGWLQVASKRIGERGLVIGVDLRDIEPVASNVKTVKMDVMEDGLIDSLLGLMPGMADVILSDLSPDLTGAWCIDHARQIELSERVLEMIPSLLKPGGSAVFKLFDGDMLMGFVKRAKRSFKHAKLFKPPASRPASSELYLICRGYNPG